MPLIKVIKKTKIHHSLTVKEAIEDQAPWLWPWVSGLEDPQPGRQSQWLEAHGHGYGGWDIMVTFKTKLVTCRSYAKSSIQFDSKC